MRQCPHPECFCLPLGIARSHALGRRKLSNSGLRKRDVLARFRRPPPPAPFLTSSTVPAGTSFQEIPAPGVVKGDAELQEPVPAMAAPMITAAPKSEGIDVQGVHVPRKPRPPGDEECCMSGCVHCVYTIYAEELEEYAGALEKARAALENAHVPEKDWPVQTKKLERKEGEKGMVEKAKKEMEEKMDPTTAAFFALENKLKKKQAPDSSAATNT